MDTKESLLKLLKKIPYDDPLFKKIARVINLMELERRYGREYHGQDRNHHTSGKQHKPAQEV